MLRSRVEAANPTRGLKLADDGMSQWIVEPRIAFRKDPFRRATHNFEDIRQDGLGGGPAAGAAGRGPRTEITAPQARASERTFHWPGRSWKGP